MAIGNSGYISPKVKTSKQNGEVFGINRMFDVYNARLDDKWVFAPVVQLELSSTAVNETDNRSVGVSVSAAGYPDGTELFWTIQGVSGTVDSSDFSVGFTGSFQLSGSLAGSTGSFEVRVRADGTADGQDQFVIQIREDSTSGPIVRTSETITIEDSSVILVRPTVTGGTVSVLNGYIYHTFTSNGTLDISGGTLTEADYLLVGGGGGNGTSGGYFNGGGGAGGYRSFTLQELSDGLYPITIGAGGTNGNGTETTFNGLSAAGGGASQRGGVTANSGGSGGGGGSRFGGSVAVGGAGNVPATTPPQGNNGANGFNFTSGSYSSSGGGGAGAAGVVATRAAAGNGGVGLQWLNGTYYAGGGGGSAYWESQSAITRGVGGLGGGGNGFLAGPATNASTELPSTNGAANTGGGAGGSAPTGGGSGVFILRYPE